MGEGSQAAADCLNLLAICRLLCAVRSLKRSGGLKSIPSKLVSTTMGAKFVMGPGFAAKREAKIRSERR